jgi:hypothetical protein
MPPPVTWENARTSVSSIRPRQFLAQGALLAEVLDHGVEPHPAGAQQHVPDQ